MATTNLRSSSQLYIDADVQVNSKKLQLVASGVADSDAVNMGQLNAAVAGIGGAIHAPVADLAAAKAVATNVAPAGHADRMIMLVESLGLYRYDAQGTDAGNDDTVIVPTDVTTPGRWYKISSVITDHNNLSGKQGGTVGEYYHLTSAELTKLTGIEAAADVTDAGNVGSSIGGATVITTIADADKMAVTVGGVLKTLSWAYVKSILKTYFDTLYNLYVHPNHGASGNGDATSAADGDITIRVKAVTLAKMNDMATASFIGRNTTATGVPEVLSIATVKTMLSIGAQSAAVRSYRATPAGLVNGSNTVFTIGSLVLSGTEEVYKNGILMNAGAGNDYTITYGATTTITFLTAPSTVGTYTDVILVNYSV